MLLLGIDAGFRYHERLRIDRDNIENARRARVSQAVYKIEESDRSPIVIIKQLSQFGSVTQTHLSDGTRVFHVITPGTDDDIEVKTYPHGLEVSIDFAHPIRVPSSLWLGYVGALVLLEWVIPALLLLGIVSFFLPHHQRIWPLTIALIGVTAVLMNLNAAHWLTFRLWSLVQFETAAVAVAAIFWRSRKKAPGFCHRCNYNLTGNTSGICPECGTPRPLANVEALAKNLEMLG